MQVSKFLCTIVW